MNTKKKKLTVMVTGVGGGGLGEQIIKALRLSPTIDYNIIGSDMSPLSKGLAVVDVPCLLPAASAPDYMEKLLAICKQQHVKCLFHGSEAELLKLSECREEIEAEGILVPMNPKEVISIGMDKSRTIEFLKQEGFLYPQTYRIANIEDIDAIKDFPVVLKPSVGGGGSANVMIAQNKDELFVFCKYLFNSYTEFIVQEYVGTPQAEYTVGVLSDLNGEFINSIAVRRNILSALSNRIKVPNLSGKKDLGPILAISSGVSQGEIGEFREVTEVCERMANKLGSTGAINIQCRLVNNQVYVFEINPRFSGTTSLRAMVGYNEPDVLVRKHIFGEHIEPRFDYEEGYIMRGLEESFFKN